MALFIEHQSTGAWRAPAAQDRLDARHQLARAEGLADVIVGAEVETDEAVDLLDARRHHHDRHVAEAAELAADLEPVAAREHQVQENEIGRVRAHPGHDLESICDAMRLEALGPEVIGLERGELGFVLDDQDLLHGAAGSETETRRPPSGEGVAAMSPPCAAAMLRQMARPRPVPPLARLREPSTR